MKPLFIAISITSLLLSSAIVSAKTINFTIEGIKSSEGKIYVQLFKGEENYKSNKAHLSSIAIAKQGQVTITFNDLGVDDLDNDHLETGDVNNNDYGIRYFHDENDNASMESNLFGMPIEGYGYSNNAKANYGPVKYAQIKFQLANETVLNTSTIVY